MSADVASSLKNWSASEASNLPAGTTAISSNLDDNLRQIQAVVRQDLASKGSDIAAAGTTDVGAVAGNYHDITGTTTVTGLGTVSSGIWKLLQFDSTPQLNNSTAFGLPTTANITAEAGDHLLAYSLGSGNWNIPFYHRKSGLPVNGDFPDSFFRVVGSSDATKKLAIEVDGFTTATTRTLTVPDASGRLAFSTETDGTTAYPEKYIAGLTIANNSGDATNDIDIAAGSARDSTNVKNIALGSSLTKRLDASWAVGTNQGGLDTGAIANSDYFVWLIIRSDTGVVDVLFSLSSTAPTMPADYDYKRLIGWIRRSGGAILAFSSFELSGGGLDYLWAALPLDVDVSNQGNTAILRTLSVPVGISVVAVMNIMASDPDAPVAIYVSSPYANDQAAITTASPLGTIRTPTTATGAAGVAKIRTNTSAEVRTVSESGGTNSVLRIATLGFEWSRR